MSSGWAKFTSWQQAQEQDGASVPELLGRGCTGSLQRRWVLNPNLLSVLPVHQAEDLLALVTTQLGYSDSLFYLVMKSQTPKQL